MKGSTYVTTEVATLLARLGKMADGNNDTKDLLGKAMAFLRKAFDERVAEMKKEKTQHLTNSDIDYLYLCTIAADNTSANKAYTYLKGLLLKADRKTDIRTKAMTAIILGKDNATAKEYVRSIKEFTVARRALDAISTRQGLPTAGETTRYPHMWLPLRPSLPSHPRTTSA